MGILMFSYLTRLFFNMLNKKYLTRYCTEKQLTTFTRKYIIQVCEFFYVIADISKQFLFVY